MVLKPIKMVLFIFFTFFLLGCESKKEELVVGISPWPGYEPLVLALELDFYDNTNVKIIRYNTPTETFKALHDGVVDVSCFTIDEVLHHLKDLHKPKAFLIMDVSNGGDALLAKPHIKTINDLKGKRIGVENSALGQYMVNRIFDFSDNLTSEEVIIKYVEIGSQPKAYKNNELDAVITYNPSKSIMLDEGANVLFDSSQIPYEIIDVMITHSANIKSKKDELIDLRNGWFKALEYIAENKKEAMKKMAEYELVDADAFQKSFDELYIPSLKENIQLLENNGSKLYRSASKVSSYIYKNDTASSHYNVNDLFDSTVVTNKKI